MPTSERPVALTTPTVTVWSSPNGLPIAIAPSPSPPAAAGAGRGGVVRQDVAAPVDDPARAEPGPVELLRARPPPAEELVEEVLERGIVGERPRHRRRGPPAGGPGPGGGA